MNELLCAGFFMREEKTDGVQSREIKRNRKHLLHNKPVIGGAAVQFQLKTIIIKNDNNSVAIIFFLGRFA